MHLFQPVVGGMHRSRPLAGSSAHAPFPAVAVGGINNVAAIQPAVGGGAVVAAPAIAALGRHWQRHATGLSLPRLLDLFRKQYTAEVIYEAFKSLPLLVSKKKRGSSRSCPPATWCTTLPIAY